MEEKQHYLSVIIPTLNEAENLNQLIPFLQAELRTIKHEIIVVDAMSDDETESVLKNYGLKAEACSKRCRAIQMNMGARKARGNVFYFLHADTRPPNGFFKDIFKAINEGYPMGCFRYKFKSQRLLLAINGFFTRFDKIFFRGGDQSLYILSEEFKRLGGYRDDYRIMEDYEFILRARKELDFKIIPRNLLVSDRKYHENNYILVNYANFRVFRLFLKGAPQEKLIATYRRLLKHPKAESLE